ncbi:MAG: hypothetical protein GX825_07855, partial [Syntrophomonadaceae bacterium]|nr:hypothetical protein [Syntrophomonadaceae bacterium]
MAQLISLEEAISVSCENIQPLDSEYLYINNANMRVLAEDINSTIDIPNFDRSAVDGYAIGTIDLEKLNAGHRACLQVAATIQAGAAERKQVRIGEAYRIMTGAMIPEGCAAIIKQEDVGLEGGHIVVCGSWKKGKNILRAGYELRAGDNVCTRGQIISPEVLERIAACGINKILVHKIPRIYVIDTGTELVLPGSDINTGQIYGSSRSL